MVSDWLMWLNTNSGAASAVLTVGLVVFAGVQFWAQWSQRGEMVRAREAQVQPIVNVSRVEILEQGPVLISLLVAIHITNIGMRAAISVRGHLMHGQMKFHPRGWREHHAGAQSGDRWSLERWIDVESREPLLLELGSEGPYPLFELDTVSDSQPLKPEGEFRVEYRDILGKWWRTEVPLKFVLEIDRGAYSCKEIVVLDQDAKVREIRKPSIHQDGLAVDDSVGRRIRDRIWARIARSPLH